MFRPSDDATVFPFLVPSNFLLLLACASSLIWSARYLAIAHLPANEALTDEVVVALQQCAIVQHPKHGVVYAFELGGYGSALLMDDANIPCLLSQQTIRCISIPAALPYRPDNPWFLRVINLKAMAARIHWLL